MYMKTDLHKLLQQRHSVRAFDNQQQLTRQDLKALLWAGLGRNEYKFTSPSAGALNPLKLYVLARNVKGFPPFSVLEWDPDIEVVSLFDTIKELQFNRLCGSNAFLNASASVLITADVERTSRKYTNRAMRYIYLECGHVAQNIILTCGSLNLGSVPVGATRDSLMQELTGISELPCYMVLIGYEET